MADEKTIEQLLVEKHKQCRGRKGQFTEILDHYSEEILRMASQGKTIAYIKKYIRVSLSYDFGYDKLICPLHRAIYSYIQKHKNVVLPEPSNEPDISPVKIIPSKKKRDDEEEEEEEKVSTETSNDSDLGYQYTNEEEVKNAFNPFN